MSNMSNGGKAEGIGESWTERISGLFYEPIGDKGNDSGS